MSAQDEGVKQETRELTILISDSVLQFEEEEEKKRSEREESKKGASEFGQVRMNSSDF